MAMRRFNDNEMGNVSGGIKFTNLGTYNEPTKVGDGTLAFAARNRVNVKLENAQDVNNWCDFMIDKASKLSNNEEKAEHIACWNEYRDYALDLINDGDEVNEFNWSGRDVIGDYNKFLGN